MTEDSTRQPSLTTDRSQVRPQESWIWIVLLLLVLTAGAYFRFTGIFWGDYSYLHPDERFFIQVTSHLTPVKTLGEYFNTATSTLNPHNVGDAYYVYGTFPIIATRYLVGSIFDQVGWEQILQVGRSFSAVMDMVTVLLVYLLGSRLFNRKVGVISAAFSAFAVMQIQQSHFYTSDSFSTTFTTMALYFAARLATQPLTDPKVGSPQKWYQSETVRNSIWFGVAIGMAMACKINTGLMAVQLPAAWFIYWMRHPKQQRVDLVYDAMRDLLIGGFFAILLFRIFQPYAFQGPGVFGLLPNQKWLANLRELAAQMSGDVDFPPALQWARRSVTFSFENMVKWGMGLPMAIVSWGSFIWMGVRQLNGSWKRTLLIWGWTAIYFTWQSMQGNPTMRYQLPIYPSLALIGGWGLASLWEIGKRKNEEGKTKSGGWVQIGSAALVVVSLAATFAWAFAFSRIYSRPHTRVEASRWIMDNIDGPVNLTLKTEDGLEKQVLPYNPTLVLSSGETVSLTFTAQSAGILSSFQFTSIQDLNYYNEEKTLYLTVFDAGSATKILGYGFITDTFSYNDGSLLRWNVPLEMPVTVEAGKTYRVNIDIQGPITGLGFSGAAAATIHTLGSSVQQDLPMMIDPIRQEQPREIQFLANQTGQLTQVRLPHVLDTRLGSETKTLQLSVGEMYSPLGPFAQTEITSNFLADEDPRGEAVSWTLDTPVTLVAGTIYSIKMELAPSPGALAVFGDTIAVESTWDDGIPIRIDNYDPYGGIYEGDLNFEMYWDDNTDKLSRFKAVLDRADYVTISSNRQWGTTTRVPERYPLTTEFYRNLIGCPEQVDLLYCYRTAEVGSYNGLLGFDLIQVFESYPSIANFQINDQFAEEAFTVYDHPKVFIFKKSADYSQQKVAAILDAVDLSNVVHVTPGSAPDYPADLMLPGSIFARQVQGGTWSEIFDTESVLNRYPWVGTAVWYLAILLLGWIFFPILRILMKGLPDSGYPLSKITALLLATWMVWVAGSNGIAFSRSLIWAAAGGLAAVGSFLAIRQREVLRSDIRRNWRFFLTVEAVGLAFFVLFLFIRLGNPDLWHPNYGGEKPMDFAYFNAVLKSTTFPPYNPWYAGSWINYYYYGFVIAAIPTKALGIVPSVAYNLILPTFYSFAALGAFSFGWNLQQWYKKRETEMTATHQPRMAPWIAGLMSAIGMMILGNLGTVKMMWEGTVKLAAPGGVIEGFGVFQKITWFFQGMVKYLAGTPLAYYPADYYWIPSRAVKGGDAITEFPFFTFLYGDPHAHMFALPITLLVLGWILSLVLDDTRWKSLNQRREWLPLCGSFFIGALAIGALRVTNTWDMPTSLGLAIVAVLYSAVKFLDLPHWLLPKFPAVLRRVLVAAGLAIGLVLLTLILYKPFQDWYAQAYSEITLWWGDRTTLKDYFTHWGLFLVVIISWLIHEAVDWMDKTPVSALNKLRPFRSLIIAAAVLMLVVVLFLTFQQKVKIAWLALTMAVLALLLLFRPGQPEPKRVVLFMIGSAAVLTLAVEVIVLVGDINRMNTVFKFYLQSWTLLSLSAAAGLYWMLPHIEVKWKSGWRNLWTAIVGLLVVGALFYPLTAAPAKIRDRMSEKAPHTLDGMAFMQGATYYDQNGALDLSADYRAIRWMQENIIGSPVIVEGNLTEYRWGSRISIYTGLPTTIGWNWHQRQQRAAVPDTSIWMRIDEVSLFYNTTDLQQSIKFLQKYNVKYIVVGGLELATYDADGLAKFKEFDGQYWNQVYVDGNTAIYEVANEL